MVLISTAPPALSPDSVALYYTTDPLLDAPVLIFHGPSITTNYTLSSSRIQAHIFTPAGFQSYQRLTISPNSPLYAAVNHLPREKQGDETCRGLAVSLLKYFMEIPEIVKSKLVEQASLGRPGGVAPKMFDEMHAGDLASKMVKVENLIEVIRDVQAVLVEKTISWIDVDFVLPQWSIRPAKTIEDEAARSDEAGDDPALLLYGVYAPLVKAFGAPAFLPTSKLRRAPSKPTAINRTRSLLKAQKESLRREMCELVDTEERYVSKIYDLVHSVAEEFRQKAQSKPPGSTSPSEEAMQRLFPPSLNKILEVNTKFLDAIRAVLDTTENEAIEDIQAEVHTESAGSRTGSTPRKRDATGAVTFAKVLLDWFPRFTEAYQGYMRASTEFPQILNNFLKNNASSFSHRVHETGEQRLRSMLIEPVQRLPRYSLFIDGIANLLPATHPALHILLKARDIITDICSLDSAASKDHSNVVTSLRRMTASWPDSLAPQGRLIAAADFTELQPPYRTDIQADDDAAGVILLFKDCVIILRKPTGCTMSARGVLAEADRPSAPSVAGPGSGGHLIAPYLTFGGCLDLEHIRFSESHNNCMTWMSFNHQIHRQGPVGHNMVSNPTSGAGEYAFCLTGAYEGKSSKWSEEVVKARVEGRFPEVEREGEKWGLRGVQDPAESLGLLTAIFEDVGDGAVSGLRAPANVRVVVDDAATNTAVAMRNSGVEIIASIKILSDDLYRLEVDGLYDYATTETVTSIDLFSVLMKRISNLLSMHSQPQNPVMTDCMLSSSRRILKSLTIVTDGARVRHKSFRPHSPVKMISQFLGGGSMRELGSPPKQRVPQPILKDIPTMLPPSRLPSRSGSQKIANEEKTASQVTLVGIHASDSQQVPLKLLEETFATYMLALRSRSGNVVGRLLRNRACADRLAVNELYNALLEDPLKVQAAAEVPVDVLFAAFENFLAGAWKEQMGPVMPPQTLSEIQHKCDTLLPSAFEEYFRTTFGEMAPQNRRAFAAIMKLLADLLDASGSDGDRGALTATFAELIVREGNPLEYITLLDRLVDDSDRLFVCRPTDSTLSLFGQLTRTLDTPPATSNGEATPINGSMNSQRARSVNSGSLSSNTSSLRKRFGFGTLSRENSRNETESRVGSVWRTLSKNAKVTSDGDSQPGSMSKASLMRSKSTDTDGRVTAPRRPVSRDRPTIQSAFSSEDQLFRPGSGHNNISSLTTIGEAPAGAVGPRKKRRSSLSDLKSTQDRSITPSWAPLQPRKPFSVQQPVQRPGSSPRTPSPTKTLAGGSPNRFGSPSRKENSPSMSRNTLTERAVNRRSDEVVITTYSPKKRNNSQSGIPMLKGGLKERPSPVNGAESPKKAPSSPQKLRMQSPQKLRERLQNEQKAISGVESALQAELRMIGEEMSALTLQSTATNTFTTPTSSNTDLGSLPGRLNTLESKIPTAISDLTSRIASVQKDLETSLQVSERKAKKLDELYREANAENEALYDRFNDELGKVLKVVKGGQGVEEMKAKLKDAQTEAATLRKENQKLKRERVGLRSQLRSE